MKKEKDKNKRMIKYQSLKRNNLITNLGVILGPSTDVSELGAILKKCKKILSSNIENFVVKLGRLQVSSMAAHVLAMAAIFLLVPTFVGKYQHVLSL